MHGTGAHSRAPPAVPQASKDIDFGARVGKATHSMFQWILGRYEASEAKDSPRLKRTSPQSQRAPPPAKLPAGVIAVNGVNGANGVLSNGSSPRPQRRAGPELL